MNVKNALELEEERINSISSIQIIAEIYSKSYGMRINIQN